jgi:hypothetical protein
MRRRFCVVAVAVTTILAGALLYGDAEATDVRMGGTFLMNNYEGSPGEDLYPLLMSENSWTVVLHDVWYECEEEYGDFRTRLHAASFEIEFFGPEAELLNSVVGSQLAQGGYEGEYFLVSHLSDESSAWFSFTARPADPSQGVDWGVDGVTGMDDFPPDGLGCPTIGAFELNAWHTMLSDHRGPEYGWYEAANSSNLWLELVTPLSKSSWGAVKALYR